ncbi:telomerase reverse transcriptase, putative [Plasmodium knowlesi strain H]|uniref:Telomerase reverse transcriptase n=3 Tax=Plasmodium knowlesi TaxID=5850 RepID=A0A5K1VEI5_PLAKH|nr:telomerase reverse transcriptase, putative [Plasmodium knowlesi strain H]OTN63594.1 putative Telomerase reverse transcriptase [Plasmodium knowlesi]CAA9990748.1 telomerase reverse transcriptase, putative [Plasmodium knowlesi strain H]SBO21161.1 telomerase reverse transcriptase, putative [Plasmodium knowlesi strain H]SBO21621.1 telomerase reverse transcriptase, putative [Plasmodium knowlesi strain H]VVS80222.1 telomerase reverse transcriptase, putative [Plasmodium knowlesi strain H]|eukprot:XP_002262037.1 hypothetical protein, conserved in Plasmodium species [Plasmodium knowlesi strain H]
MMQGGTCEDGGHHVRSDNNVIRDNCVIGQNYVVRENYLRNVFQCTDKKVKIFKTYLKKKLKVESYTLGEYSLKHDEKFRRIFFANILKEHVIAKRNKDKLFILNEVIMDRKFFEEDFFYQYFLQNVLLLEDLTLKRLEGNHHGDFLFKEKKKNGILNWKQGYSHIKKKLNEKGNDQKSKIYKNSVLLFNSTKFSYEDKNCCDYFYSLKVWDIFFNYVSFDFLNYLLSNTLIFISDFFFINLTHKLPLQNSFLVLVSHVDLKYDQNKQLQDTIFSRKRKLPYNTKQVKILYQRDHPRRTLKKVLLRKETHEVVGLQPDGNPPQEGPSPLHINGTSEKRHSHRGDESVEGEAKEEFQSVSKSNCARSGSKRKIDQGGIDDKVIAGRKCKKKKMVPEDTSKEEKQIDIDGLKYGIENREAQRKIDTHPDDTQIDGQQYKYLFKKKKEAVRRNEVNSYANHLYLVQCSGRIIKNEFLNEMKQIQKETEQAEEAPGDDIEVSEKGIENLNEEEQSAQRKVLPQISFFSNNKAEGGPPTNWKCKTPQEEKKKWSKIIINRNNILQHNTTNKYKNFLLNKSILFDKIDNVPLFTYHLLNYIFKSDQKYFFHNNFIDEYKNKISKQIKCNTKKNDISSLLLRKESTTSSNVLLCSRSEDKRNNVSARLKKTKILKYVYCHFEEFIKNTRNANFDKMYRQYFPKNKMKNRIRKIFKTIKSHIIHKYKIVNIRRNRKFIKQKMYDVFFKNYDFLSFSFKTYQVINFLVHITKKCVPVKLLGNRHNFKVFIKNVKNFVLLNYKENFTMDQMMKHVRVKNVFQKGEISHRYEHRQGRSAEVAAPEGNATQTMTHALPNLCSTDTIYQKDKTWKSKRSTKQIRFFDPEKNKSLFETLRRKYLKKKKKIHIALLKRHLLNRLIYFLFNYFIMPVIRKYFFLTKSEHTIYKTIFFDRISWNYFTKVSNFCLYHQNFRGKKLKRRSESGGKDQTRNGKLKRRKLQKDHIISKGGKLETTRAEKVINEQEGINASPRVIQIRGRQIEKEKKFRSPALPNRKEKKRKKSQNALIRSTKKKETSKCGKNERRGNSSSGEPNKRIEDLYEMTILSKKTVRPYLRKFYYKVKKKYFSLRKKYLLHGRKRIPLGDKQFAHYLHFVEQRGHLFRFICRRFFKKTRRNYVKRFYRLVKRIKRRMMGIKHDPDGGVKRRIDNKVIVLCGKNDQIKRTKKRALAITTLSMGATMRENLPERKKKNIHIHKLKSMIEKRNFLLKLNSINRFFSKKLRINWVPKKKGLRPLINLSTLNIPESVKNRIREILKNKKSSEFYFHNILNNMERDSKEKKSGKKKYNRKNFNPVSLNHICNFSLKCLGNVRNNNRALFQNTLTKTNDTELKLKKWLDYLKNWFYRKKKNKKYIKNKLKKGKVIYAYICIGDFSNCYEHIKHNYLFKILKHFFHGISNFEFIYVFKRSFRLYSHYMNNSLLTYYPVNVQEFGIHCIKNLRELIVKSNLNKSHSFLLRQFFKNTSCTDLYIFSDSYKSVQVETRDIFMTIITIIRYYYLNIYFSIKEIKMQWKNIFYFQLFQHEKREGIYRSFRSRRKLDHLRRLQEGEEVENTLEGGRCLPDDESGNRMNSIQVKHLPLSAAITTSTSERGDGEGGEDEKSSSTKLPRQNKDQLMVRKPGENDKEMILLTKGEGANIICSDKVHPNCSNRSVTNFPDRNPRAETEAEKGVRTYAEKNFLTFQDKKIISDICGLPQGFCLSNILCSMYYAYLDRNEEFQNILYSEKYQDRTSTSHLQKKNVNEVNYQSLNSLLIRFIDDFLFITVNKKNMKQFKRLLLTRKIWGENINSSKTKIFKLPLIFKSNLFLDNFWGEKVVSGGKRCHTEGQRHPTVLNQPCTSEHPPSLTNEYTSPDPYLMTPEEECRTPSGSTVSSAMSEPKRRRKIIPERNETVQKIPTNDNLARSAKCNMSRGEEKRRITSVKGTVKIVKKKGGKLSEGQTRKIIKELLEKRKRFRGKSSSTGRQKIKKYLKRLSRLLRLKRQMRRSEKSSCVNRYYGIHPRTVMSIEWLNNTYTFDFANNCVHSISSQWKNKQDATIRNHLHLTNGIGEKSSPINYMKFLVEGRIMRNVISKMKKNKMIYKNKQNIYFAYKNNFILLKSSILKFICSIKSLKKMFNAFYNDGYNTKFIFHLISYLRKSLIKNRKIKFVKLFLVDTAMEALRYARVFNSSSPLFPCLRRLRTVRRRLINRYKRRNMRTNRRDHLVQYYGLFGLLREELRNTWPYMFKIREDSSLHNPLR